MDFAVAIGIAYPVTSAEPDEAAVAMPTTSPSESRTGPPESPETMSAATSMSPESDSVPVPDSLCTWMAWSVAVTVPSAATRLPVPSALPTSVTASPVFAPPSSSSETVDSPEASLSLRTATSFVASAPTTSASYCLPVVSSVTLMLVAPWMTWLLVRIVPSEVSTMPVPAACDAAS